MKADNFNLSDYLARIGFIGEIKPDIDTIRKMMRCQIFSVPFENLDVQAGKSISLIPEEIVEKIVTRRRGGYCYEVNGIFAMALESLGIAYRFVAARPMVYPVRRPKTHMAILLTLDAEEWLCDLGFGSHGIRYPLRMNQLDCEIQQDGDVFKLSKNPNDCYLLQTISEGKWANQYEFDLSSQEWVDFVPANHFNSTHPEALFVQRLIIVLHTVHGKKILSGNVFKSIENDAIHTIRVAEDKIASILSNEFGLCNVPLKQSRA